jgi:hypothetical protein
MTQQEPVEAALIVLRQIDKGNARSVIEFWMGFRVNDLTLWRDGAAIEDQGEFIGFAGQEHVAGLDLHPPEAQVSGLTDSQSVKVDERDRAVDLKAWVFTFLLPPLAHVGLRLKEGVPLGKRNATWPKTFLAPCIERVRQAGSD